MGKSAEAADASDTRRMKHPVLRRLRDRTIRCSEMTDMSEINSDPAWLRIPAKRRDMALRRHEALLEYKEGEPSHERARVSAGKAGVSIRTFYNLLPEWDLKAGPDIWALVPYSQAKYDRRSRLGPEAEAVLKQLIESILDDGVRGTVRISGEVRGRWPKEGPKMPTPATIRHHVDSRGGFDSVEKGSISLNTGGHPQETGDTATQYGEVLVIDHSAVELFLGHTRQPKRATLTLALDLLTASVAGVSVAAVPPNPKLLIAALEDAQLRTAGASGERIIPRLLYAGTSGEGWSELADLIAARGLISKVRWGTRLHFGGPIRRMIGTKLADIQLYSRKMHERSGANDRFDPAKHALVTLDEARIVVEDAVRKLNTERLAGITTASILTNTLVADSGH